MVLEEDPLLKKASLCEKNCEVSRHCMWYSGGKAKLGPKYSRDEFRADLLKQTKELRTVLEGNVEKAWLPGLLYVDSAKLLRVARARRRGPRRPPGPDRGTGPMASAEAGTQLLGGLGSLPPLRLGDGARRPPRMDLPHQPGEARLRPQ